jgi:hypothetical protein
MNLHGKLQMFHFDYLHIRTILLLCFVFVVFLNGHAQMEANIKRQGSGYIWGEGTGKTLQEADKNALDDLISQISVRVESDFSSVTRQDGMDFNQYVDIVVNTYSTAYLGQTKRLVNEGSNRTTVLRYIHESDIGKLFEQRKQKIFDFVAAADHALDELRIADALRYYYWSLSLLRTHPDNNSLRYAIPGRPEKQMMHALNDQLVHIMKSLQITISSICDYPEEKRREIMLNVTWNGKPAQNLEYTYWTGHDWTRPVAIANGTGIMEFFGETYDLLNEYRIQLEYAFLSLARFDEELQSVMQQTDPYRFSEALMLLRSNVKPEPAELAFSNPPEVHTLNQFSETVRHQDVVMDFIPAINAGKPESVKKHFTNEGFEMFQLLCSNGKVRVLANPDSLSIMALNNEVMVRSLPMSFAYHNNTRTFVENVVFIFNEEGKVNSMTFALSNIAIEDILGKDERFGSTEDKFHIIRFMEDYKTAYNLKRLEFIEAVFDDNALIIVGSVLKKDETRQLDGLYGQLGDRVQYIKLSKQEFVGRLRRVFNSNEFVNIQFEDNTVRKVGGDDKVYGIQIAQHYHSSNYADKGYLFLMLDLNDTLNPRIYVRSWQPEKNPDGSIIGLADFHF